MSYHRLMTVNPNPSAAEPPAVAAQGRVPQFTLGDRLRKARESSGMDQSHLAEAIDLHRQTVARYESDAIGRPKRYVLLSWSMATGVSLDWIAGIDETPTHVDQTAGS